MAGSATNAGYCRQRGRIFTKVIGGFVFDLQAKRKKRKKQKCIGYRNAETFGRKRFLLDVCVVVSVERRYNEYSFRPLYSISSLNKECPPTRTTNADAHMNHLVATRGAHPFCTVAFLAHMSMPPSLSGCAVIGQAHLG